MIEKKSYLFVVMLFATLFIAACSSADDGVVIIDEETGEEIVVPKEEIEEKENEILEYCDLLSNVFNESISLQDTFAHALDAMFTKDSTLGQFAKILKDNVVDSSRDILDEGEKYNFPADYYEMNQMVVMNLKNQHQLFLM